MKTNNNRYIPDFRPLLFGSSAYKAALFIRSINALVTRGTVFLGLVLFLQLRGNDFTSIALLTTVYFAPQLLFSLFVGRLSDALQNRRWFITIGFVGSGMIFFFYPLAGWIGYALTMRFVQGVFESTIRPLTQTIAANEGSSDTRGNNVSLFKMTVFGGSSLGPIVVGYVIQFLGYRTLFWATGAVMILAGLIGWYLIKLPAQQEISRSGEFGELFSFQKLKSILLEKSIFSSPRGQDPRPFSYRKIKEDPASLFLFITFVRRLAFNMFLTFIPIYLASNLLLETSMVGILEGMRRFMIVVSIVLSGALADSLGRKPLLVLATFSFLGPLMYVIFPTLSGVWLASLLLGLTIGLYNPTSITYMADLSPPRKEGTYLGFLESTSGVSRFIGPIVGGLLADFFGLSTVFTVAGLIIFLTVIPSLLLRETYEG